MAVKVKRTLTLLVITALALPAWAQGSLEIIALKHRTADQVIPILQPLLEPGGTLTGQYGQLIVRTSPRNLADLRAALDAIDRPLRRLTISVRFEDDASADRFGVAADSRGVRIAESRSASEERVDQRVQVLEGGRALIASGQSRPLQQRQVIRTPTGVIVQDSTAIQDIATGFEVVARVSGRNVVLEIAPQREVPGALPGSVRSQRAASTVSAPLGEWFEIAGTGQSAREDRSGILSSAQGRSAQERRIWVKVEESRN